MDTAKKSDDVEVIKVFSAKLEEIRGVLGLTQREMAARIGSPLSSYTNWTMGMSCPSAVAVVRVSRALGVSADDLLGLKRK